MTSLPVLYRPDPDTVARYRMPNGDRLSPATADGGGVVAFIPRRSGKWRAELAALRSCWMRGETTMMVSAKVEPLRHVYAKRFYE